jgi:hypothetical protein
MKNKRIILLFVYIMFLIIFLVTLFIFIKKNNENYLGLNLGNIDTCTRFPNLPQCLRIRKPPLPRIPPYIQLKPSQSKKRALCVSGGAMLVTSTAHGIISSILSHKRTTSGNFNMKVSELLNNINYFSGTSGGNIFLSLLSYDKTYNDDINGITNMTAEAVSRKYHDTYVSAFIDIRDRENGFQPSNFDILELPYFLSLILDLMTINNPGILSIGSSNKRLAQAYLLDRQRNKKLKQLLPEYNNKIFTLNTSVITTGVLNVGKKSNITYSYNLPTGNSADCRDVIPFNHGPLTSRSTIDGIVIDEYRSTTLDTLRYWDGWSRPPGPLPDNKMFDTCKWVQKYEDDWFSNTPEDFRVYRCKNVASSDCCQKNSNLTKCSDMSLLLFTSKPGINSVTAAPNIYNNKTNYFAYNLETEKNPTGEWEDMVTSSVPDVGFKLVSEVPTKLNTMVYDTSEEYLEDVANVTTAFFGHYTLNPCLVKAMMYAGGFSDQELFVQRFLRIGLKLGTAINTSNNTHTPNNRLYENLCEAVDCSSTSDNMATLSKISKVQPLMLADAGYIENSGIVSSVITFQNQHKQNLRDAPTLEILAIVRDILNIQILFNRNPLLVDEEGNQRWYETLEDSLAEVGDIINTVANFNVLEEAAISSGVISATAIVSVLSSLLSPIIGISVAVLIASSITEIVWEAIDLDTDGHVTTDNYGKTFRASLHARAAHIFNNDEIPDEIFETTFNDEVGDVRRFSIRRYENLTTKDNYFFGVKAGTKINITAIETQTTGDLIPYFSDGENMEFAVKVAFEGIEAAYQDPVGRRILNKTI